MKLNPESIDKLAHLARLKLNADEVEGFPEQVNAVLGYVAKLSKVKTKDVPEMMHAGGLNHIVREDKEEGCEAEMREDALSNFPKREGDLLAVQGVFEDKKEEL